MLGAEPGRAFVEASQLDAVVSGARTPTPLVLRAAVGDCIEISLHNQLPAGASPVSLHADGVAYDPADSGGVEAGNNPPQTVPVGSTRTYTFFAHPEYGTGAAMLRDGGDLAYSGSRGLYGAVAVAPEGSTFDDAESWSTVVRAPNGDAWRDVVLFMHDADDAIGTHRMPYTSAVRGAVGLNYGRGETGPVINAYTGDPLRVHVLAPWSEQVQTFSIEGHRWPVEPAMDGSTLVSSIAIGGLGVITVAPEGGAGGETALPGRYELGDHREPYREAGLTGTLIVHDTTTTVDGLDRLTNESTGTPAANPDSPGTSPPPTSATITQPSAAPTDAGNSSPVGPVVLTVAIAGAAATVAGLVWRNRRRIRR